METVILLAGLGFVMVVAEMFLPGMVLGILGGILLIAAIVMGFTTFGVGGGTVVFCVVLAGTVAGFLVWMATFQKTPIGRSLTLGRTLRAGNDLPPETGLVGMAGRTVTALRPSGKVLIGDRRWDVVSEGGYVGEGEDVTVIRAVGNQIVVRRLG